MFGSPYKPYKRHLVITVAAALVLSLVIAATAAYAANWFVFGPGYVPSPSSGTAYVNQTVYPGTGFVSILQTTSDVNYAIIPNNWVITSGTAYTYQSAASSSSGGYTWFYGTTGTVSSNYLIALSVSSTYNVGVGSSTSLSTATKYGMVMTVYYVSSETSATLYDKCDVSVSSASTDYRVVFFGNATWSVVETYSSSTSGSGWDAPYINLGTYTLSPGWYLFACSVYDSSGAYINAYGTSGVSTSSSSFTNLGTEYYIGPSISGNTLVMPFVTTLYQPFVNGETIYTYPVVGISGSSTSGAFLVSGPASSANVVGSTIYIDLFNATTLPTTITIQGISCPGGVFEVSHIIPPNNTQLLSCSSLTSPSSGFAIYPTIYSVYSATPSTATINFFNPSGQSVSAYPTLTMNGTKIGYALFSTTAYQMPQYVISKNPYGGATGTYGLLNYLAIQKNGTWVVINFYWQPGMRGVILGFSNAQYSSSPNSYSPWIYIGTNNYLYVADWVGSLFAVSFPLTPGWHTLIAGEYYGGGGKYYIVAYLDSTSNSKSTTATSLPQLFGNGGPCPYNDIGTGYTSGSWPNTNGVWFFYNGYINYIAIYGGNKSVTLLNNLLTWLSNTGGNALPPNLGSYGPYAIYTTSSLSGGVWHDVSGVGNKATLVSGTNPASLSYPYPSVSQFTLLVSTYVSSGYTEMLGVTPNKIANSYFIVNVTSFAMGTNTTYYVPVAVNPNYYVGMALIPTKPYNVTIYMWNPVNVPLQSTTMTVTINGTIRLTPTISTTTNTYVYVPLYFYPPPSRILQETIGVTPNKYGNNYYYLYNATTLALSSSSIMLYMPYVAGPLAYAGSAFLTGMSLSGSNNVTIAFFNPSGQPVSIYPTLTVNTTLFRVQYPSTWYTVIFNGVNGGHVETLGITPNLFISNFYFSNSTTYTLPSTPSNTTYYVPVAVSPYGYIGYTFFNSPYIALFNITLFNHVFQPSTFNATVKYLPTGTSGSLMNVMYLMFLNNSYFINANYLIGGGSVNYVFNPSVAEAMGINKVFMAQNYVGPALTVTSTQLNDPLLFTFTMGNNTYWLNMTSVNGYTTYFPLPQIPPNGEVDMWILGPRYLSIPMRVLEVLNPNFLPYMPVVTSVSIYNYVGVWKYGFVGTVSYGRQAGFLAFPTTYMPLYVVLNGTIGIPTMLLEYLPIDYLYISSTATTPYTQAILYTFITRPSFFWSNVMGVGILLPGNGTYILVSGNYSLPPPSNTIINVPSTLLGSYVDVAFVDYNGGNATVETTLTPFMYATIYVPESGTNATTIIITTQTTQTSTSYILLIAVVAAAALSAIAIVIAIAKHRRRIREASAPTWL